MNVRQGTENIIKNAEREVRYAKTCLDCLKAEEEAEELWRHWSALLDHYVKAVSAMRRATNNGTTKAWSDRLLSEQKSDPVLHYAFQSRDHANHVFESLRTAAPRSTSWKSKTFGNVRFTGDNSDIRFFKTTTDPDGNTKEHLVAEMNTKDGRYQSGSLKEDEVSERPAFIELTDVKTRSGLHSVPDLGVDKPRQAAEIGDRIIDWLETKLSDVQSPS